MAPSEADMKRVNVMSWLFGDKLSGSELARNQAARPPRSITYLLLAMRLLAIGVMLASAFHVKDRLPIVGPWLSAEWWRGIAVVIPLLVVPEAVAWFYRRRVKSRPADREGTLDWPQ